MNCPYCGCIDLDIISSFAHVCCGCNEIVYNDELFEDYFDDKVE